MGARVKRYLRDVLAMGSPPDRSPMNVSVCLTLAIVLAPSAMGLRKLPGSLASAPDVMGQACAIALALGCLAKVLGNLHPVRDVGLPWELMGSTVLAVGFVFYAVAVLSASETFAQAQVPFGLGMGLGVGCALRATQILLYVRSRATDAAASKE